jgi:hypothetical protein
MGRPRFPVGRQAGAIRTRLGVLLVFAGIWALTESIVDVVRAFQIREVDKQL